MNTYEDDLESTKENMWSKLLELADVATMVYDEEQRQKKGKSKIVSEEELRKKKGKSKIVYEEEEEEDEKYRFFDYVPRKVRSSLRYSEQQRNYENLNGASTSSSSSSHRHLPRFETRTWLHYNTPDIESPPNPNSQSSSSQTESTSNRKRLALVLQQRSSSGKFKKAKVVASLPRIARGPPEWLGEVMREMGVTNEDPMLIFDFVKPLSASDVNSGLSRFLLPFSMLTRNDFLTPAESAAILRADIDDQNIGVGTLLVNKNSEMWGLRFKLWAMEKKESGNGTLNYALNWGWTDVVKGNRLKEGHEISLWSFRCRGVLCFALEHRIPNLSKRSLH